MGYTSFIITLIKGLNTLFLKKNTYSVPKQDIETIIARDVV